MSPKIYIADAIRPGLWGGGNQFLKDLREEFRKLGAYVDSPEKSDLILINAHQNLVEKMRLRLRYPKKTFIHRLAGILGTQRGNRGARLDALTSKACVAVADGVVFQSHWAKAQWSQILPLTLPSTVILNATGFSLLRPAEKPKAPPFRIIATAWSDNRCKGAPILEYLDQHLDFSRYQLSFFGNTIASYKHIQVHAPVNREALHETFVRSHLYLAASENDACSNALVEALEAGLVAIAKRSGGHPEVTASRGVLFDDTHDVLQMLDLASDKLQALQKQPAGTKTITEVAKAYLKFGDEILKSVPSNSLSRRTFYRLALGSKLDALDESLCYHLLKLKRQMVGRLTAVRHGAKDSRG